MNEHRSYICLATAALAIVALLCLAGCKTPPPAPVYGATTVAPPATGMVGQPAPYGTYATPPQAVAYPPPPGAPMPGPATTWQGVSQPATAPTNTWSWSQSGSTTAPTLQQPSLQQYSNQYTQQANQYANQYTQQANQYANQLQNQANQYANQTQQQLNNTLQNTANQYQQGFNNQVQQYNNQLQQGVQSTQQQFNNQLQQAMPSAPQTQTVNGNWWPFSDTSAMPPARATPTSVPKY